MNLHSKSGSPGLDVFDDDAGGAFVVALIRRWQINPSRLMAALLAGDRDAQLLSGSFNNLHANIVAGCGQCLLCATMLAAVSDPFIWLLPARSDPSAALAGGFCASCAGLDDAVLMTRSEEVLRRRWGDLRTIDPAHLAPTGGMA